MGDGDEAKVPVSEPPPPSLHMKSHEESLVKELGATLVDTDDDSTCEVPARAPPQNVNNLNVAQQQGEALANVSPSPVERSRSVPASLTTPSRASDPGVNSSSTGYANVHLGEIRISVEESNEGAEDDDNDDGFVRPALTLAEHVAQYESDEEEKEEEEQHIFSKEELENQVKKRILKSKPLHSKSHALIFQVVIVGFILTFNAGFVNGVALTNSEFPQTVTHVSGRSTSVGKTWVSGAAVRGLYVMAIIFFFFSGSAFTACIIGNSGFNLNRRYGVVILIESVLLLAATVVLLNGIEVGMFLLAAAAGTQNALTTTYGTAVLRTTHVTGLVTDMGIIVGQSLHFRKCVECWKLKIFIPLLIGFVSGGFVGAASVEVIGFFSLLIPAIILFCVGVIHVIFRVQISKLCIFPGDGDFSDYTSADSRESEYGESSFSSLSYYTDDEESNIGGAGQTSRGPRRIERQLSNSSGVRAPSRQNSFDRKLPRTSSEGSFRAYLNESQRSLPRTFSDASMKLPGSLETGADIAQPMAAGRASQTSQGSLGREVIGTEERPSGRHGGVEGHELHRQTSTASGRFGQHGGEESSEKKKGTMFDKISKLVGYHPELVVLDDGETRRRRHHSSRRDTTYVKDHHAHVDNSPNALESTIIDRAPTLVKRSQSHMPEFSRHRHLSMASDVDDAHHHRNHHHHHTHHNHHNHEHHHSRHNKERHPLEDPPSYQRTSSRHGLISSRIVDRDHDQENSLFMRQHRYLARRHHDKHGHHRHRHHRHHQNEHHHHRQHHHHQDVQGPSLKSVRSEQNVLREKHRPEMSADVGHLPGAGVLLSSDKSKRPLHRQPTIREESRSDDKEKGQHQFGEPSARIEGPSGEETPAKSQVADVPFLEKPPSPIEKVKSNLSQSSRMHGPENAPLRTDSPIEKEEEKVQATD